nr:MAG TPA: hypothetical protein [Caudoviricetes sp.]
MVHQKKIYANSYTCIGLHVKRTFSKNRERSFLCLSFNLCK